MMGTEHPRCEAAYMALHSRPGFICKALRYLQKDLPPTPTTEGRVKIVIPGFGEMAKKLRCSTATARSCFYRLRGACWLRVVEHGNKEIHCELALERSAGLVRYLPEDIVYDVT